MAYSLFDTSSWILWAFFLSSCPTMNLIRHGAHLGALAAKYCGCDWASNFAAFGWRWQFSVAFALSGIGSFPIRCWLDQLPVLFKQFQVVQLATFTAYDPKRITCSATSSVFAIYSLGMLMLAAGIDPVGVVYVLFQADVKTCSMQVWFKNT